MTDGVLIFGTEFQARHESGSRHGATSNRTSSKFLAPAPLRALLESLARDLEVFERRAPNSEIARTLSSVREELSRAVSEAQRIDLWISVDQAHAMTGKPISTLTRLCRKSAASIGAQKVGRAWTIHLPTFEAFLMRPQTATRAEAA